MAVDRLYMSLFMFLMCNSWIMMMMMMMMMMIIIIIIII